MKNWTSIEQQKEKNMVSAAPGCYNRTSPPAFEGQESSKGLSKSLSEIFAGIIQNFIKGNPPLPTAVDSQLARSVRELDLSGLRVVTGIQLKQLAQYFPSVEKIILREIPTMNDSEVSSLTQFQNLQELDISGNPGITGSTFAELPPTLRVLRCTSCNVSDKNIELLKKGTLIYK